MKPVFNFPFKLHYFDIDSKGRFSIFALANYLQDAAGAHASALNISIHDLFKLELSWVLTSLRVEIYKMPASNDELFIRTWPSQKQRLSVVRDFLVYSKDESLCYAKASSKWSVIDLKERKAILVPDIITKYYENTYPALYQDGLKKIKRSKEYSFKTDFALRLRDIDINGHTNNVSYLEAVVESIPFEVKKNYFIKEINIDFKGESFYPGSFIVESENILDEINEKEYIHRVLNKKDNKLLCIASSSWELE